MRLKKGGKIMIPKEIEILKEGIREYLETNPIRKLVDKILLAYSKKEGIDLIAIFFAVKEGKYSFIGIQFEEKGKAVNIDEKQEEIELAENEMRTFREIIKKCFMIEESKYGNVALFELKK